MNGLILFLKESNLKSRSSSFWNPPSLRRTCISRALYDGSKEGGAKVESEREGSDCLLFSRRSNSLLFFFLLDPFESLFVERYSREL